MAEQQNLTEVFNSLNPVTEIGSIDGLGNQVNTTPTKILEPIAFGNFPRDHFAPKLTTQETETTQTPVDGSSKRKPVPLNLQKYVGIWAGKFTHKLSTAWKGKPLSQYRAQDDINLKTFVIIPLLKPSDALDYIAAIGYSYKGTIDAESLRCFAVQDNEGTPIALMYHDGFDGLRYRALPDSKFAADISVHIIEQSLKTGICVSRSSSVINLSTFNSYQYDEVLMWLKMTLLKELGDDAITADKASSTARKSGAGAQDKGFFLSGTHMGIAVSVNRGIGKSTTVSITGSFNIRRHVALVVLNARNMHSPGMEEATVEEAEEENEEKALMELIQQKFDKENPVTAPPLKKRELIDLLDEDTESAPQASALSVMIKTEVPPSPAPAQAPTVTIIQVPTISEKEREEATRVIENAAVEKVVGLIAAATYYDPATPKRSASKPRTEDEEKLILLQHGIKVEKIARERLFLCKTLSKEIEILTGDVSAQQAFGTESYYLAPDFAALGKTPHNAKTSRNAIAADLSFVMQSVPCVLIEIDDQEREFIKHHITKRRNKNLPTETTPSLALPLPEVSTRALTPADAIEVERRTDVAAAFQAPTNPFDKDGSLSEEETNSPIYSDHDGMVLKSVAKDAFREGALLNMPALEVVRHATAFLPFVASPTYEELLNIPQPQLTSTETMFRRCHRTAFNAHFELIEEIMAPEDTPVWIFPRMCPDMCIGRLNRVVYTDGPIYLEMHPWDTMNNQMFRSPTGRVQGACYDIYTAACPAPWPFTEKRLPIYDQKKAATWTKPPVTSEDPVECYYTDTDFGHDGNPKGYADYRPNRRYVNADLCSIGRAKLHTDITTLAMIKPQTKMSVLSFITENYEESKINSKAIRQAIAWFKNQENDEPTAEEEETGMQRKVVSRERSEESSYSQARQGRSEGGTNKRTSSVTWNQDTNNNRNKRVSTQDINRPKDTTKRPNWQQGKSTGYQSSRNDTHFNNSSNSSTHANKQINRRDKGRRGDRE